MRIARRSFSLIAILLLGSNASPQVPSPKYESRLRHIFGAHRDTDNLQERFENIKCALVLIEAGPRLGTGFYISRDGDLATASHVLGNRVFSRNPDSTIKVSIGIPRLFSITNCKGERTEVSIKSVEVNPDAWLSDVALIKTGKTTAYWLKRADDRHSQPGEHLISMGFPGLSFKALTLYTGIMSARLTTVLPTIILDTGEAVPPPNDFIRVQMPISTGLSGAPIIDDENRALAIVTNAGGWSQDLENLMVAFRGGAFQVPPSPPDPNQPPNTVNFTLSPMAVMAELAGLFHDYASPGYGDAVPLRYLKRPPRQNQPSASPDR